MTRRTKIVATVGPASDSPEGIASLIDAGVDVFRLGTAHDPVAKVIERVETIREVAANYSRPVGILVDLAGPKVRAAFGSEPVELVAGSQITIRSGQQTSSPTELYVNVEDLASSLEIGDRLYMGDGSAALLVTAVGDDHAIATIERGGIMRGRPGVHVPSSRLTQGSPTEEDLEYYDAVVNVGVDMVAMSFVKTGRDLRALQGDRPPHGPLLVAKIETAEAVENLDSILQNCDGVMVARGDLGLELSLPSLPALQKQIIMAGVAAGKPVITATQMLESMTSASTPTRAEVTDVANAVFDGSSAVMLSGETAVGHDPALVVRTMSEILVEAESSFDHHEWSERVDKLVSSALNPTYEQRVAAAIRTAANRAAQKLESRAVVAVTGSGRTARFISRYRPEAQIVAVSPTELVARQLCLSWGVTPTVGPAEGTGTRRVMKILSRLRDQGHLIEGELVPIMIGNSNSAVVSNVLRIEHVPAPGDF